MRPAQRRHWMPDPRSRSSGRAQDFWTASAAGRSRCERKDPGAGVQDFPADVCLRVGRDARRAGGRPRGPRVVFSGSLRPGTTRFREGRHVAMAASGSRSRALCRSRSAGHGVVPSRPSESLVPAGFRPPAPLRQRRARPSPHRCSADRRSRPRHGGLAPEEASTIRSSWPASMSSSPPAGAGRALRARGRGKVARRAAASAVALRRSRRREPPAVRAGIVLAVYLLASS
jgi:hypothetical protein